MRACSMQEALSFDLPGLGVWRRASLRIRSYVLVLVPTTVHV
jgi:hypothetical protein